MVSPQYVQRIGIFVSSPGDMDTERQIIKRVVEELNARPSFKSRYRFEAQLYEEVVPPATGDFAQMIVDRFMNVQSAYIVVGMMWSRMGTPFKHPQTREPFESGTEYEIKLAARASADSPRQEPHLLLYRKSSPSPQADPVQQAKVDAFFKNIETQQGEVKGLYQKFSAPAEFRKMLLQHIEQILVANPPPDPEADAGDPPSPPPRNRIDQSNGAAAQGNNNQVSSKHINTSGGDYVGGGVGGDFVKGNKNSYRNSNHFEAQQLIIEEKEHPQITLLKREIATINNQDLPALRQQLEDARFQQRKRQTIERSTAAQRNIQSLLAILVIIVVAVVLATNNHSALLGGEIAVGGIVAFLILRKLFTRKPPKSSMEQLQAQIAELEEVVANKEAQITQHYAKAAKARAGNRSTTNKGA